MSFNNKIYNIDVETITPISIGNGGGEILSPYTDFVFDENSNHIHLLDKEAVSKAIVSQGKELMNEYVSLIRGSFDNNRSNFDLRTFIEKKDKVNLSKEEYSRLKIPYRGLNSRDRREIKCMVKNGDQPFLPGSSLKGAIKAALLYDWFLNEAKEEMDRLMKLVMSTYRACKDEIKEFEQLARKQRLDWKERKDLFRLKKDIANKRIGNKPVGAYKLAKEFDKTISQLLTEQYKKIELPRDFSLFKVGDSMPMSIDTTMFQLAKRLHYNKGTVSIPVNLECIAPRSTTQFRLALEQRFSHPELKFLNKEDGILELFKRINKFHKDNIDTELELLDTFDWYRQVRPRERAVFEHYQAFLEEKYDLIDNALPHEAYLCVGFGKSFFYNSIGMLIRDWDDSDSKFHDEDITAFQKYCTLFFIGKDGQRNFPMTRTIVGKGVPMGWMKLVWRK